MTTFLPDHHQVEDLGDALMLDERMRALGSIYQLADSVLSGEPVKVNVGRAHGTVPAWTSGTEIFINTSAVGAEDFENIVRMHGLNFHELAHVLYTPRAGTKLAQHCIDNALMPAFNVLEDQRIESMLTAKYPATAPWLTAAVLRWVVKDPGALMRGYMFVRGRRYLPGDLRGIMRQMFERRDLLAEIDRVVDAYRQLVFPTDYDQAKSLVEAMQNILNEFRNPVSDPNGHSYNEYHVCDKGRPAPVKEQRELRDKMGTESSDKDDQDSEKDGQSESPQSKSDDDDSSSHDGSSSDDEFGDDGSTTLDDGGVSTYGSGSLDEDQVRETLEQMLEDLLSSNEVREDIRRTQRTMDRACGTQTLPYAKYTEEVPDSEYALIERRLTQILESLREEAEPGWHRREDFGRLNVVRWAIEKDPVEAFDRWDEGITDAVDIEAVLMLDVSGSMGAAMWPSHNAMWALKRAFDAVEISSTVIIYDGSSEVLYSNQDRATSVVRYSPKGGSTNPIAGLNQASRIFAASQRKHKVLVVLTDGQWGPGVDDYGLGSEDYIVRLNDDGVLTCLGFIPSWWEEEQASTDANRAQQIIEENRHRCTLAGLASGNALVPFIGDIVTGLIRSRIRSGR